MAPSPRKRAAVTFDQTWHETDATFFDPGALPVSKAPRAWERKQETVVTRDGKERKVWRRYTTRSKQTNTTNPDEDQEEEHDSRFRAVKKLQRVKPEDMEQMTATPRRKKRAFKATRWDRRKSVLPRKKASAPDALQSTSDRIGDADRIDENAIDTMDANNESSSEWEIVDLEDAKPELASIVTSNKRRSTFTFTVEEGHHEDISPIQDGSFEIHGASVSPAHVSDPEATDTSSPHVPVSREPSPLNENFEVSAHEAEELLQSPNQEETEAPNATSGTNVVEEDGAQSTAKSAEMFEATNGIHTSEETSQSESETSLVAPTDADVAYDFEDIREQTLEQDKPTIVLDSSATGPNESEDTEVLEFTIDLGDPEIQHPEPMKSTEIEAVVGSGKEEFAEASLQLDFQHEMDLSEPVAEMSSPRKPTEQETPIEEVATIDEDIEKNATMPGDNTDNIEDDVSSDSSTQENPTPLLADIADGLTLSSSLSLSAEFTPRKLCSPSPPPRMEPVPDEGTTTMYLDDDTALLKDFLTRAAASKANKVANIARRSSLQNRRDSDAVRHALASPRKILEDKDPNSPSKYDNDATLDLSQTLTLSMDQQPSLSLPQDQADIEACEGGKASKNSRRSTRTRNSRLPAPSSATQQAQTPKNISLRRADGGEPIVLKKTEAQELGLLTRTNTRKNKQGALAVNLKLLKLATEAVSFSSQDDSTTSSMGPQPLPGKKSVRWDETLAYYQEGVDALADALAEAQSLATPDELSVTISTPSSKGRPRETKDKDTKNETPRVRRVRGLGAANGTPGKALLAPAAMLPDGVVNEKETAPEKMQRAPKASKLKKLMVASAPTEDTSSSTASGAQTSTSAMPAKSIAPARDSKPALERKSRLATPRKVKLPQPRSVTPSVPAEGKENQSQHAKGLGGVTPKKGLRLPEVIVPPMVESGLPRRRAGRKA